MKGKAQALVFQDQFRLLGDIGAEHRPGGGEARARIGLVDHATGCPALKSVHPSHRNDHPAENSVDIDDRPAAQDRQPAAQVLR